MNMLKDRALGEKAPVGGINAVRILRLKHNNRVGRRFRSKMRIPPIPFWTPTLYWVEAGCIWWVFRIGGFCCACLMGLPITKRGHREMGGGTIR